MSQLNAFTGKEDTTIKRKRIAWNRGKVKCISCEKYLDIEDTEVCEKGTICIDCFESDPMDSMSCILYGENEKLDTLHSGNYRYYSENEDEGLSYALYKALKWISTDAWRGYYDIDLKILNRLYYGLPWVTIENSWFCPLDGHNMSDTLEILRDKIEKEIYPSFDLLMCFPRTSNVCSTGYEILIHSKDKKRFTDFLK